MPNYSVLVGNIGTVYDGPDKVTADLEFAAYVGQSRSRYGRAAGEPVTYFCDGEIIDEYPGDPE